MEFDEVVKKRRSVRNFLTKLDVSLDILEKIIESGMEAPSVGDLQPWQFIIIKKRENIEKIAEYSFQDWIKSANTLIVVVGEKNLVKLSYEERVCENLHQTIGACIQNMLLKATELGVGSCWIGVFDKEKIEELLEIPKTKECCAIIALGYSNEKPRKKIKKSLELNTFFEKYGKKFEGN